jgi:hypothetical protein
MSAETIIYTPAFPAEYYEFQLRKDFYYSDEDVNRESHRRRPESHSNKTECPEH